MNVLVNFNQIYDKICTGCFIQFYMRSICLDGRGSVNGSTVVTCGCC